MACAELKRLLEELDFAERQLTASRGKGVESEKARQLAEQIRIHREQHADCDFKPVAN